MITLTAVFFLVHPQNQTRKTQHFICFRKKVEHPTRRATGVIKYPLEEVAENGETPTEEMEPNLEKRKSVQFDTINIDELEIEKPEDDDNDFMGDSEAEDGDDTRRTSRV